MSTAIIGAPDDATMSFVDASSHEMVYYDNHSEYFSDVQTISQAIERMDSLNEDVCELARELKYVSRMDQGQYIVDIQHDILETTDIAMALCHYLSNNGELSRAISVDNAGRPRSGEEQYSYEQYVRSMRRMMYVMSSLWAAKNAEEWQAALMELLESQDDLDLEMDQ